MDNRAMLSVMLTTLYSMTLDDMFRAINTNSEYREQGAKQWATKLAHTAFELHPELRLP